MSSRIYTPGEMIPIGYDGEINARERRIDISSLIAMWPGATPTLMIRRSGDEAAWPAKTELAGGIMIWTIGEAEAAVAGRGGWQIQMRDTEKHILGKSADGEIMVRKSLAAGDKPPNAVGSWVADVLDAAKRAEAAADRAESAGGVTDEQLGKVVEDYLKENPVGGVTKEELEETVEDALQEAKDSGAFDGYTPQKGIDYFDGAPGSPGKPGYTPQKGVDYFDGYTPQKGVDYFDGAPGYTPQKGVDYWTAADKQEIISDVLAALPNAQGVTF